MKKRGDQVVASGISDYSHGDRYLSHDSRQTQAPVPVTTEPEIINGRRGVWNFCAHNQKPFIIITKKRGKRCVKKGKITRLFGNLPYLCIRKVTKNIILCVYTPKEKE